MAVKIVRRQGLDDTEVVAEWREGAGFVAGDLPFTDDPAYDHYDEAQLLDEFDGPDFFAVAVDRQKSLGVWKGDTTAGAESGEGKRYIDRVDEAPDDATVHAETDDEGDVTRLYYIPQRA